MADQTHDVHESADGKHRWVEGCGGIYRHPQQFFGAPRDAHPEATTPDAEFVPLGMVILRCRCGDPDSHSQQGKHCPQAEVDAAESYALSTTFNVK